MTDTRPDSESTNDPSASDRDAARYQRDEDAARIHFGHSLEEGVLARIREWTDLLPGLRLVNVLRLAGSPAAVGIVAFTTVLWFLGLRCMGWSYELGAVTFDGWLGRLFPLRVFGLLLDVITLSTPFSVLIVGFSWRWLLAWVWTAVLWLPPVMYLLRQGARLTAGRDLGDAIDELRYSVRRIVPAAIVVVMPALCTLPFVAAALLGRWIDGFIGSWTLIGVGLGILVSLILLPAGVLGFGSFFSVPLSLSAIVNERDPDALDALSRGYEVLFRRPLHLLGNVIAAWGIVVAIGTLVAGLAWFTSSLAGRLLLANPGGDVNSLMTETMQLMFRFVPLCVVFALSWGLTGGVYLLTRQATGGNEVEDLYMPDGNRRPELPELPRT